MRTQNTRIHEGARSRGRAEEILGTNIFGVSGDKPVRYILTATVARQPASQRKEALPIPIKVAELIPTVFRELETLAL